VIELGSGIFARARSDRAFKFAGRVAGDSVASHADFAYIDALTQLIWIKVCVLPGYASTLLIGVLNLLRTRCEADSACCQNNSCWQLHRAQ
jgi:hypothetical protein